MNPQPGDSGRPDQYHQTQPGAADMPAERASTIYATGECEIDVARRELRVRGVSVPIGARAFEIMAFLLRSSGTVVTKDALMNHVWPGAVVTDNLLQTHAMAIRKALGPFRHLLKTESGRGYRLLGDWQPVARQPAAVPAGQPRAEPVAPARMSNLPPSLARLVGRGQVAQRVQDLLTAYRCVTLTGTGGIGKTALALEVARCLEIGFSGGGWLVELAACSEPSLVPAAVAGALGLGPAAGVVSGETVARMIGAGTVLLVLDNCEHVIEAVALLVETILSTCPGVKILSTSRESIGIPGEFGYVVPPLDVPADGETDPARILQCTAAQLFLARAEEAGADLAAMAEHAPAVGAICRQLDGIPLAIEFAAVRAATLGVAQVAAGMREPLALLAGGRRNAPPRHRTLRATLDWSYQLLTATERSLLHRLAAFAGPFSLESAFDAADADMSQSDVVDGIVSLVRKSLIVRTVGTALDRFRLFETTRAYARERRRESGAGGSAGCAAVP